MKKLSVLAASVCLALASCGGMGGTTTGANGSDILGGIIGVLTNGSGVVNAISSVIGLDKLTAQDLVGTWRYNGTGCAFTSENLLAKAGGEVVASQIEEKLLPYYQKVGLSSNNTVIAFNNDKTFTATIAGKSFSGTYTYNEATSQIAMKGLLLNINCYAKREMNGISILFEAKKLLTVLQTMSALSGNVSLQTIGDLSKNYEGVRIGFDMTR